jgi:hypothetical protein
VLETTPREEKLALDSHTDQTGTYRGFKPRQYYE